MLIKKKKKKKKEERFNRTKQTIAEFLTYRYVFVRTTDKRWPIAHKSNENSEKAEKIYLLSFCNFSYTTIECDVSSHVLLSCLI